MRERLRASAALAAFALALHQLRYLAARGDAAVETMAREGHGYITYAAPFVVMALALALVELGASWQHRRAPGRAIPLSRRWTSAGLGLLAIYAAQELLEGALVATHASGVAGLVASGGWTAGPLAAVLGLLMALLLRGADELLLRRAREPRRLPRPVDEVSPAPHAWRPVPAPLARHLAGRSPPLASGRS